MFGQMDGGIANPFSSSNLNSFGGTSTSESVFGQTSVPTFGSSSLSLSSPFSCSFGQKMGSFGGFGLLSNQSNPFTSTGSAFSASNSPAFGASSGFAFGASSSPGPGNSSSFSFGTSSAPAFGESSSSAFFFGSTPASSSPLSFGAQTDQPGGNKNEAYKWTPHDEQSNAKMESISAMPSLKDSSHKELGLADYQHSDKGEPSPPTSGSGFQKTNPSSPFSAASVFGQTASNPNFFSFTSQSTQNASPFSSIPESNMNLYSSVEPSNSNPFSMNKTNATSCCLASQAKQNQTQSPNSFPFSFTSQSLENQNSSPFCFTSKSKQNQNQNLNPFSFYPQSNPNSNANCFSFTSQSNQNENLFSSFANDLNQNPSSSPFVAKPSPIFSSSSTSSSNLYVFGNATTQAMGTCASNSNANTTQANGLAPCTTPDFGRQSSNGLWSVSPPFGEAAGTKPPTTASASVSTPSSSQATARNQTPSVFSFGKNNDNQISQGGTGASASSQQVDSQTVMDTQAAPSEDLFGALPSASHMSVGLCCSISSVQYGISCLPVGDRSTPSRGSLSVPRHFSQRRVRLPLRRYHTKTDAPEVLFYAQRPEAFYAPKLDAFVIPRQNRRNVTVTDHAIVNNDDWLGDVVCDKLPKHLENHLPVPNLPTKQNDDLVSSGEQSDSTASPAFEQEDDLDDCDLNLDENDENTPPPSTVDFNHSTQKGLQAAIVYEHGAEIEALMPKLRHADYYTEPRIQDLAARERADPGFCSRVPDFVVGRTGYGCIKFLGETDVRKLDLEAIVQFGNKEVVVYRDEKKKPVVGQGLNKPAEVALLNIKCINKKTGDRYLTGPKVERYKEMLAKKTAEQRGEFLSYDPMKAEWRFKVKHFSRYGLLYLPGDS